MLDFLYNAAPECVLEDAIKDRFPGKIALVSSFGTESAILLRMVSEIDKSLPIVFLDTLKLFPETLSYRDELVGRLGLTDVRNIRPSGKQLAAFDPDGTLWQKDADMCCIIRKANPLDEALEGMEAWITGRKRSQGGQRANIQMVETGPDGRVNVNPLAFWTDEQIAAYFEKHNLPRHPLQFEGYASIGCATCTTRTLDAADKRSGRWAGQNKTECGIHLPRANAA
ncbi:MAG: phosphoadenosine phosphosulfate reductase [Acidocella sp. 20-57-95]|nr:MAG: phosphoadenosine phosphosulfate reductase [Acidocella sp. 20-57-95]OYV61864.1 MAG: phosphoadenosine phosphosulfate reductase [Acidocella sp. 21-58-7]HQT63614.1 phosphoadenylyl-sulfate reductase [Acidocella sp.]HQU04192.1 phosphoadenylyl-sulfate reductase [Acidocella sp.]